MSKMGVLDGWAEASWGGEEWTIKLEIVKGTCSFLSDCTPTLQNDIREETHEHPAHEAGLFVLSHPTWWFLVFLPCFFGLPVVLIQIIYSSVNWYFSSFLCPVLILVYFSHQKSSTLSHEMSGLNWKPFVYGGLASIVAEFGKNLKKG